MSVWNDAKVYAFDGRGVRAARGHAVTITTEPAPADALVPPPPIAEVLGRCVGLPPADAARFDCGCILAAMPTEAWTEPMRRDAVAEVVVMILGACLDARYLEPLALMECDLRVWKLAGGLYGDEYAPVVFDDGTMRLVVMPRRGDRRTEGATHFVTVNP